MGDMVYLIAPLGVVFGGAVLFFIYVNYIKPALLSGKSIEGKAEALLKKDLSPGYARYTFYQYHNYNKPYSQSEWKALYEAAQKAIQKVDKESEMYAALLAPFINAIVVDGGGYYARRGMENRANSLEKFMPGVNDRVLLNYFVEPYKYVKDEQRAAESVQAEQERAKRIAAEAAASYSAASEVREAEKRYRDAVYKYERFKDSHLKTHYEIEKQKAYAALLAAQSKAANSK